MITDRQWEDLDEAIRAFDKAASTTIGSEAILGVLLRLAAASAVVVRTARSVLEAHTEERSSEAPKP